MNSIICTLFEKHYHFGLAGLVNSLERNNFKGDIYAGYKGSLPPWASNVKENPTLKWEGSSTLSLSDDVRLHFLPIKNNFHLTNYKPYFMLELFQTSGINADSVTYFDPDIIVKCNWTFFETWMTHGVGLVHEIISNDMPGSHPIRFEWKKVIKMANKVTIRDLRSYINGGFCAVTRANIEFLNTWCDITNTAMQHFGLTADQWSHSYDRTYMFYAQDQDTLNIAAMCSQSPISEMGPEAMDFVHGGFTMSHAVGSPKPWKKKYISSALRGVGPSLTDRAYWLYANSTIKAHSYFEIRSKLLAMKVAAFIGRFNKRT
ncbi:hypothetical protein WG906_16090 [Pedobacter sp. P351]|uniref:hypothetical protein n=1 Tax=Pedobacter superstes TaxID=3133441 RepID=UPI0030B25ED3